MSAAANQIQADIEALKSHFTNTQELYREVAAVLFFRYGLTPTANKLYQLVRKGSMTAPAEALNRFWADLREKSRVRIEAPGLPEELTRQAGSLLAALWDLAQSQAQDSLAHFRNDKEEQLIALRLERDTALTAETASRNAHEALVRSNAQLEDKLAASAAAKLALEIKLAASDEERDRLQQVITESRASFSQELEKVRASLHAIEARSEAEIKRYLLEIDRERMLATKAGKELNEAKAKMEKQQAADKAAISKLQDQVSSLRETSGSLQGQLVQLKKQYSENQKKLTSANAKLSKVAAPKAVARRGK